MSTFSYDGTDIHAVYDRSRLLPPETIELWLNELSAAIDGRPVRSIVDLGCGTGRFTASLAGHFGAAATGVDPSEKMLSAARRTAGPSVDFRIGSAASIPVDDASADLLFLSMVYHHIPDKIAAARELRRVLDPMGSVAIRLAPRDTIADWLWAGFFPSAFRIERERIPSRIELIRQMEGNGFRLDRHAIVVQQYAASHAEYAEKIALRGLSSLNEISEEEFAAGVERLREHCRAIRPDVPVVEELDLFIFRPEPDISTPSE